MNEKIYKMLEDILNSSPTRKTRKNCK